MKLTERPAGFIDMLGKKCGKLTVVSQAPSRPGKAVRAMWNCVCECGNMTTVSGQDLRTGHTISCGCNIRVAQENARRANTTHGMSKTSFYNVWAGMIQRCYTTSARMYHNYGGRGITVCPEWLDSFEAFRDDMYEGYSSHLELDRKDNEQGYSKANCHWVTPKVNAHNKRTNRIVETPDGPMHLSEASEKYNISASLLHYRLARGYEGDKLFSKPRPPQVVRVADPSKEKQNA